ncbi:alpha-1,3-mannosyl-glycoprotein 4-beta-N-acetylglucosaminyltransferase-like protein MGAT4D [Hippopotamus amphibius kiboko]|uniref:alpha-1,3-mannosyl-glycoprotein 4-beta-N-acetylglucosaminyltransferase-like protein MGAT4D n=1 Tax=Hippopotamus amphibius kiboko TaxID=575201 RepID=UPI00259781F7|nr:alpha-1,3-mannosyl-glycoprotein 4-beta-N-acetylglucosaminyltransferase-like protein MGAT4D [Hippopotamus amphibius kiboko]
MRSRHVNLLIALVAVVLFSFSCFCISRMTQTSNQLTNCRNHISEFKETILRLKNKTEVNRQELLEVISEVTYETQERKNASANSVKKKVNALDENETVSNAFEVLKFFFPHLRKVDRIYPNVIIGKEKTGVSFALGISTVSRGNYSYLKQTLTSVISRMTLAEEKDSVVIVSIADSNEDYSQYVVDMITKKFKRQLTSGSLEVISIPAYFYPNISHAMQSTDDSAKLESWRIKQVLDFCFLMLYAQPKAMYYLQLEDDILANRMYFTKITDFVHNITSNNWFYIEFSVLGFIGKLFKSEDLTDFVRFFLMFYKDKPIDLLLGDIFQVKMCNPGETLKECTERNKHIRIRYKPSLFQHVGIQSSFPGKEQYLKSPGFAPIQLPSSIQTSISVVAVVQWVWATGFLTSPLSVPTAPSDFCVSPTREPDPGDDWPVGAARRVVARGRQTAGGGSRSARLAQRRPSAAVEPLGAGAHGTRLAPPPPPRGRPHAHARLAVAAGQPPAGLLWGDAGTERQRLLHLSCRCRKRARKTGTCTVGHLPASLCARAGVRNPSPGVFPQGGGSWTAPLSLATRQEAPAGPREGVGAEFGRGVAAGEVLGRALPASGVGRLARAAARVDATPGAVGSSRTTVSTCCSGAGAGKARGPPQPGLSPRGKGPQGAESVIPAVAVSAPFHARAPLRAPEGWRGGPVASWRCSRSRKRELNQNWLSLRAPRLCKGEGT